MTNRCRTIAASTLSTDVEQLERELKRKKDQLRYTQASCTHVWNEAVYDPESYQDLVADYTQQATHYDIPAPGRWVTKSRSRWSRACKKCGKKEYTTKQKTVKTEPDFRQEKENV